MKVNILKKFKIPAWMYKRVRLSVLVNKWSVILSIFYMWLLVIKLHDITVNLLWGSHNKFPHQNSVEEIWLRYIYHYLSQTHFFHTDAHISGHGICHRKVTSSFVPLNMSIVLLKCLNRVQSQYNVANDIAVSDILLVLSCPPEKGNFSL